MSANTHRDSGTQLKRPLSITVTLVLCMSVDTFIVSLLYRTCQAASGDAEVTEKSQSTSGDPEVAAAQ